MQFTCKIIEIVYWMDESISLIVLHGIDLILLNITNEHIWMTQVKKNTC
jgi:hypothetical protein